MREVAMGEADKVCEQCDVFTICSASPEWWAERRRVLERTGKCLVTSGLRKRQHNLFRKRDAEKPEEPKSTLDFLKLYLGMTEEKVNKYIAQGRIEQVLRVGTILFIRHHRKRIKEALNAKEEEE